ncbi:Phosphoenolpyruvate transferase [Cupriavidus laharis]|uniref:Phosphoenolpyruvate transferase n=1 Tax=Cupriavidus laharis TaxID=151654 RepID=A0ABM8X0M4_9BURK|nr:2-phospho-L-lactate transferase [Cupriavidus laharis]CAG9173409.1 Phosphoenolpyruvate transferase [Cupriavidus laharis]
MIIAFSGGVGGAKLADGLAAVLAPELLTVVVNVGDDFEHLGLRICPDLDTVMYTLAGLANPSTGWGLAGDTASFMAALERIGGETWFHLGDRDMATHVERTRLLAGMSLSEVTETFCRRLGVRHAVVPVSDDRVRTTVRTDEGLLSFQDYFVRRRCAPRVLGLTLEGADSARASERFLHAMNHPQLKAIVFCPSNPHLSIAPMLAIPQVRACLQARRVPLVAVSPIIDGNAVKGPAAKIQKELGFPVSALGVADLYKDLIDGFVLDVCDAELAPIAPMPTLVAQTLMRNPSDRRNLAEAVLEFASRLRKP